LWLSLPPELGMHARSEDNLVGESCEVKQVSFDLSVGIVLDSISDVCLKCPIALRARPWVVSKSDPEPVIPVMFLRADQSMRKGRATRTRCRR
jgi:hypothetical protein